MSATENSKASIREFEHTLVENLLQDSLDSIYFKDLESRFMRVSDYYVKRLGMKDPSEVVGMSDFDFFDSKLFSNGPAYFVNHLKGGPLQRLVNEQ